MIGTDVYACWRATLKGDVWPADKMLPTGLGGVDGHPQPGLYKKREGGGYQDEQRQPVSFVPVKIILVRDVADPASVVHKWEPGLALIAVQGKDRVIDAQKVWSWLRTSDASGKQVTVTAIPTETYKYWMEHERWPDDAPETPTANQNTRPEPVDEQGTISPHATDGAPAGIGHNSEDDPEGFDALMSLLSREQTAIENWIGQGKEGKSAADFAQNWRDKLATLEKRVLGAFAAEKEPHLRKCQEIDDKWRGAKAAAAGIKQRMVLAFNGIAARETARVQAITDAEARKRAEVLRAEQEAQHRAQVESARKAREEAAAATGELPLAEPEPLLPPPPPVVVAEKVHMTFGGASGRKAAPKAAPKCAVITDWRAAAAHYAMADTVRAAVQKLADADAKKGIICPGAEIGSKEAAA